MPGWGTGRDQQHAVGMGTDLPPKVNSDHSTEFPAEDPVSRSLGRNGGTILFFLNFPEFFWIFLNVLETPHAPNQSANPSLTPNFCKNLFRRDSVCPGNISPCQLTLHFNIKLQYKAINLVFGLWLQHKPALGQRRGHQDLGCGSHRVIKRVFGISLKFLQSLDAKTA